jgi:hypothetical protein
MMADIVNAGWVPVYLVNLSEDIPGYLSMPATTLTYPWSTLISGHLGRLGTRDDIHERRPRDPSARSVTANSHPRVSWIGRLTVPTKPAAKKDGSGSSIARSTPVGPRADQFRV